MSNNKTQTDELHDTVLAASEIENMPVVMGVWFKKVMEEFIERTSAVTAARVVRALRGSDTTAPKEDTTVSTHGVIEVPDDLAEYVVIGKRAAADIKTCLRNGMCHVTNVDGGYPCNPTKLGWIYNRPTADTLTGMEDTCGGALNPSGRCIGIIDGNHVYMFPTPLLTVLNDCHPHTHYSRYNLPKALMCVWGLVRASDNAVAKKYVLGLKSIKCYKLNIGFVTDDIA